MEQTITDSRPDPLARPIRAPMQKPDTVETVVARYIEAYKLSDRAQIESVIADEFKFTSPQDNGIGRDEYFQRCWTSMHGHVDNMMIERLMVEEAGAYVTYLVTLKDGRQLSNTEFLTFEDGKINTIHVYFGPSYKLGQFVSPDSA